tara:strand:- start:94 stop:483 length:390 start_codon:yes stop_codon:yes gene_type:complete
MRARKYNKRIEVLQTSSVSDGYGGNITSDVLLSYSWCELITTKTAYRSTDLGLIDTLDTIIIKLRHRNDLSYNNGLFFKYRGLRYTMQTEPINIGFEDREIMITLKQESIKQNNTISKAFDFTFDNTFS